MNDQDASTTPIPSRRERFLPKEGLTAADLTQAAALPADACPRRYCWWWGKLGFRWEAPPAEFCEMPSARPLPGWRFHDRPCRRADPASPVDHYEDQGNIAETDGVDCARWTAAAAEFNERLLARSASSGESEAEADSASGASQ